MKKVKTKGGEDRDKAQKFLAAGKLDKALEGFNKYLEHNPKDLRTKLKVGEVLTKLGRKEDAIKIYQEVAEKYASDGFVVQAIAINKLILELDPSQEEIQEKLASLYSARGMKAPEAGKKAEDQAKGKKVGEYPVTPIFADLNQEEFLRTMSGLGRVKYDPGDWIIKEGEKGDTIYVISQGQVSIHKTRADGNEVKISELGEGEFFGEFSFFMSHKRQASVKAEEEVELLSIGKEELDKIVEEYPRVSEILVKFYKERVLDMVLAISPLFGGIGQEERKELIGQFKLMVTEKDQVVIAEGDKGDSLYLIKDGEYQVSTSGPGGQPVVLARLRGGDFFGEVALISDQPRTATVTSETRGRLMCLSRESFNKVAGRYPAVLEVAKDFLQKRAEETISTIMTLEEGETEEVLV